nr:reverse transcriptase domain-containing protein [Tanacetum cinerariifolium]
MESVQDMSGCRDDQKVNYTAGSFVGKALTWWNSQIYTRSLDVDVSMACDDFKVLMKEEFCPSKKCRSWKLSYGIMPFLRSTMLRILIAIKNGSIKKNVEKRGNRGEPSKDMNVRDDNKSSRTVSAFAMTLSDSRADYSFVSTTFILLASFDVIIRTDWLSNHKAEIIFHQKVVRISLPGNNVHRVIGERLEEKIRHLVSAKAKEQKQEEFVVGLGANRGVEGVNENVEGVNGGVGGAPDFSTIIAQQFHNLLPVMLAQVGCSYKEFLACNPKEYDSKGGVVVLTQLIKKMENVLEMSGCNVDQKVKYTVGLFVGKALTWWNSQIHTLSWEVAVSMSWNDFKFMMIEEFCPIHEMQKLETKLWNHAMVGAGHTAYTNRFHELDRLVPHLVTPESRKIERSIKKIEKRGNVRESRKEKNGRDDNKRTRTVNAFASTANPIGRDNMGVWQKCTTCNSYHAPKGPCRTCFKCNHPGHLVKDFRGVPKHVNPVKVRNLTVRASCECGSTDHVRSACPRLNRSQGPEGNHPNQVVANNRDQGHGNQGNQARGKAFMLGAEEAR